MKNILMKESLFPIAYRKCGMSIGLFLQFISVFLFSQTFNSNNPAISVQENVILYITDDFSGEVKDLNDPKTKPSTRKTEVYIAKGANIYGAEHFGNSIFNKEKTIARRSEKRKPDISPKDQNAQLYKTEKKNHVTSFIKSSENSHTFFALFKGYPGFAVLNNSPSVQKFQFIYEELYVPVNSFVKEAIIIFSTHSSSPVREEMMAQYSRPPPFHHVLTA